MANTPFSNRFRPARATRAMKELIFHIPEEHPEEYKKERQARYERMLDTADKAEKEFGKPGSTKEKKRQAEQLKAAKGYLEEMKAWREFRQQQANDAATVTPLSAPPSRPPTPAPNDPKAALNDPKGKGKSTASRSQSVERGQSSRNNSPASRPVPAAPAASGTPPPLKPKANAATNRGRTVVKNVNK